jgi:Lar family restriction alleviation protein
MPRKKQVVFDLSDQLDIKPWKCPDCKKVYDPPLMTYISPCDGKERCGDCSSKFYRGPKLSRQGLKPCPFCGSTRTIILRPQNDGGWAVNCLECDVTGPLWKGDRCGPNTDKKMAREWWNQRAE